MGSLDYNLAAVGRDSGIPIVRQIEELIRRNIELHALEPGDRLPTERDLAEALGVARGTVKTAYRRLEQENVIRTRQGSGSFVIRDNELARRLRREKAVAILDETIVRLGGMGLSVQEISHLAEACLSQYPSRQIAITIICDTPELLLDFKRQLDYLQNASVSIFILDSVTESPHPEDLLRGADIIIVPSDCVGQVAGLLPNLSQRIIEAATSPSAETLVTLTALPRDARIGIICRSSTFLSIVKSHLLSYGFSEANILSFFEMDYTTETYFPGGIDTLISFSDAHIFTNPDFAFRNEEFWAKGGKMIAFRHQIERGTMIYIEDRTERLAAERNP